MRKVRLPALVLAGRQDPLVPLRRQEFTATLMPYGQFAIIEDSGHLAPLEQPEAVSDAIEAFLNGPIMLR
jgi:pimeloyl-ACP methyl ester carboxylesterase